MVDKRIQIISQTTTPEYPDSNEPDAEDLYEEEIKTIKNQLRQWNKDLTKVKNSEYIKLKPTSNLFVWNVLLRAKPEQQALWGTNWYRAQLVFFKGFPVKGPELRFPKRFKNLFVYTIASCNICYSSLNDWKETDTLTSVLPGVIEVLFEDPELELNDLGFAVLKKAGLSGVAPANPELAKTFIKNRAEYDQIIRDQVATASYSTEDLGFTEL